MEAAVVKIYRQLLREGFKYAGEIETPSIFMDTVGENIPICSQIGKQYLHLYIDIRADVLTRVQYLCTCDPTTNVVIETLCVLTQGKTISEARAVTEAKFYEYIGARSEELEKKVRGTLELFNRGISRYLNPPARI
jgi:hypothetical protein